MESFAVQEKRLARRGLFPVTLMVLVAHLRARNLNDVFTVLVDETFLL